MTFQLKPERTSEGYVYRRSDNQIAGETEYSEPGLWIAYPHEKGVKRISMKRAFYNLQAAEYYILAFALENYNLEI